MVNLTRIYTRTGDQGLTRLANMAQVAKTDPRLEAYGSVDEANSWLGLALAGVADDRVRHVLTAIQNDLFDVGADLATPNSPAPSHEPLRVSADWVTRLEAWCDEFSKDLPNLRSFLLPGGTELASRLHVARTVVRRAERQAWTAAQSEEINITAMRYLNRLSDLLFILARHANRLVGVEDILWQPGAKAV